MLPSECSGPLIQVLVREVSCGVVKGRLTIIELSLATDGREGGRGSRRKASLRWSGASRWCADLMLRVRDGIQVDPWAAS